jgi:hypothetical protein
MRDSFVLNCGRREILLAMIEEFKIEKADDKI